MDWVGKKLGYYDIVEQIGAGGMATVYRAHQSSLNRQVAIKVLHQDLARDPSFRERFVREARSVAQLAHPNILPVYDFGEDQDSGALYFAMQLVDGGALTSLLGQPMAVETTVRIAAQIARALDYAHKRNLVHRDVKPANVLLSQEGHPLLADFGIARLMEETRLTQTGASLGTPAYMSPEQAKGGKVDARTDIYALGVVMYEMLAGRLPFQSDTPVGMLHQHAFIIPPDLHTLRPDIPKAVEKVVMRALAKEPSERYASAAEFADALEASTTDQWPLRLTWPKFNTGQAARATGGEPTQHAPSPPAGRPVLPKFPTLPKFSTPPGLPTSPDQPAGAAPATPAGGIAGALAATIQALMHGLTSLVGFAFGLIVVALVLGLIAVGMLAEQTVARQDWKLNEVTVGVTYVYKRADFEKGMRAAIEPYTLDALTDMRVRLEAPDKILFSGSLWGQSITLQARVREADGVPRVQIERFNDFPLYIIGGILSERVNSGFEQVWEDAPIRIERMKLNEDRLEAVYRRK